MSGEERGGRRLPEPPRIDDVCCRSRLYMADLESGLHFLLRVELATHKALEGAELKTFKDFVTVSAKVGTAGLSLFVKMKWLH